MLTRDVLRCRPVALTARAPVSKTGCWGFESLLACQFNDRPLAEGCTHSACQNDRIFSKKSKIELGKVTWPTRKETIATTWVVVVIVLLISFYLGLVIVILAKLMRLILADKGISMSKKWYGVHTYSGFENKVGFHLLERIKNLKLEEYFGEILIPSETVVELEKGRETHLVPQVFPRLYTGTIWN